MKTRAFRCLGSEAALAGHLICQGAVPRRLKPGATDPTDPLQFPCPFCDSNRIGVIGGSRIFLYYRCSECAESWTAMNLRASAPKRMPLLGELTNPTIH